MSENITAAWCSRVKYLIIHPDEKSKFSRKFAYPNNIHLVPRFFLTTEL